MTQPCSSRLPGAPQPRAHLASRLDLPSRLLRYPTSLPKTLTLPALAPLISSHASPSPCPNPACLHLSWCHQDLPTPFCVSSQLYLERRAGECVDGFRAKS